MTRSELLEWVVQNLYKDGCIIHGRMKRWSASSPYWVEKHYPLVYEALQELPGRSFSEQIYLLVNNLSDVPACVECGGSVNFKTFDKGHYAYCSVLCMNNSNTLTLRKMNSKQSNGGYARATESARNTFREKYGVDWGTQALTVIEARKQTVLDRYGVDNVSKLSSFVDRRIATCLSRYGVEHPIQNSEIHDKALRAGLGRSKVRWVEDGSIWYQGEYERKFLEQVLQKGGKIERGRQLKYIALDGKEHRYTPDFVVDDTKAFEVKSVWTWDNKGKNKTLRVTNKLKLRSAKRAGYNVYLVIEGVILSYSDVIKQKELRL